MRIPLLDVSYGSRRWVVWDRSDLIVEMSPGLLVSGRPSSSPFHVEMTLSPCGCRKFQITLGDQIDPWWPPLHLYRSLGWQKVSRLGGWSNHWPLSDNTQNENGTGGHETGSVMWNLWQRVGWLPHECKGSASFGAGSLHHPRKIWE